MKSILYLVCWLKLALNSLISDIQEDALGSQVQTVARCHLAKPVPHWRKYVWRVKESWKALFHIQVWNNYWSDDWEFGEISTGFEVENSSSWWAVDDGESGVVIRVAKDPSCPGCRNHASWMQQGPASRWDHRDASQGGGWDRIHCIIGWICSRRGILRNILWISHVFEGLSWEQSAR